MDEFSFFDFLTDDDDESIFLLDFPSFEVSSQVPQVPESTVSSVVQVADNVADNVANKTATTTQFVDESRFPSMSRDEIEALKSSAANKNTSRSTKQWMNVFNTWCLSRHLGSVNIVTMKPEELDELLTQFYAEVKRQNGDDYEPDSLRIMQSGIERYLKENGYQYSITRSREFLNSQKVLDAKAVQLREQGKGKRPNKSHPLEHSHETALWEKGQLGDFNGRALTNVNFKNLTEHLGLRGRQEHYNSFVEDFVIHQHEDGSQSVEFNEGPTKTRSGGLRVRRRTTPQIMHSTDGGDRDPVRLFKQWLQKRPEGMKDNGPLYLGVIARPKSDKVWYMKQRMGENTIGSIMKSMASSLSTDKKLTNHSMRKTLVAKLKKAGQPRNVICEITGHARESSLDDYDHIDENQRKNISHIISGFESNKQTEKTSEKQTSQVCSIQRPPLAALPVCNQQQNTIYPSIHPQSFNVPPHVQSNLSHYQPSFGFPQLAGPSSNCTYTNCNFYNYSNQDVPDNSAKPTKRRRAFILESDEED